VRNSCDIGWKRNVYLNTPGPAADGGVTSTAGDLQCFLRAIRDGQLLGPALTARMLDADVAGPDEEATEEDAAIGWQWRYGYGLFFILGEDGHVLRYGLPGEEPGASCRVGHNPTLGLDLMVLGNQSWCAGEVNKHLHDLLAREAG